MSRNAVGGSLLVLSLISGCDRNPVDPSVPLFRPIEPTWSTTAAATSEVKIDVQWSDNSSNETGFEVHRSTTGPGGPFARLATTGANVTSFSDVGLTALTQYCYEVRSFRTLGGKATYSAFSTPACATTIPLPAPSGQTAVAASQTRIDVAWQDNSASESGFELYRATSGLSDFAPLASTGPGIATYSDVGLASSMQYCYKVRAFQTSAGTTRYSEFSAPVCAATGPPPAPAIWAAPGSSTAVRVVWSANPANTDGFRVERSMDGGASWTTAGAITIPWYQWSSQLTDEGRTPEQEVCYRVFAFNSSWGDSGPSNTACTAPPNGPTGLIATMVDSQTVDFAWSDNSAIEDGYVLGYFGFDEGGWGTFYEIRRLSENTTSFRLSEFDFGLSDTYFVAATMSFGYSDFSNAAVLAAAPVPVARRVQAAGRNKH